MDTKLFRILRPALALLTGMGGLASHTHAQPSAPVTTVEVDLAKTTGPLDHIWKGAGSDRAAITLREDWRKDLSRFHDEAGLQWVRFHGIFNDELDVFAPSIQTQGKEPNWQNVDRVYDGILARGVRPIVELSFMPKRLASGKQTFGFYQGNITPPKDFEAYGAFIKSFVEHLVDRYGSEEVRQWPFEVWNEPNLFFFWSGKMEDYFELYKAAATAVKSVDPAIMVGGPATSKMEWLPEFLAYCETNAVPLDFIGTHAYVGDDQEKLFGHKDAYPFSEVLPAAMRIAREQIDSTAFKGVPLYLTEWASDSPAMIAHIIKGCLGNVQLMSHWTVSNTYEELGVAEWVLKEGSNGYGMIAAAGIPKPQFNTYKLLHRLGHSRLAASNGPVLASRRDDGTAAITVWNLTEVRQPGGIPGSAPTRDVIGEHGPKKIRVVLKGMRPGQTVMVSYVDQERGSPYPEWRRIGSPQYPTMAQIEAIRKSAELAPPETLKLGSNGDLVLDLPPECLALIETDRP